MLNFSQRHFRLYQKSRNQRQRNAPMAETKNYQMAIDLLRCHLGITEDEAKQQLGLMTDAPQQHLSETQSAWLSLQSDL